MGYINISVAKLYICRLGHILFTARRSDGSIVFRISLSTR